MTWQLGGNCDGNCGQRHPSQPRAARALLPAASIPAPCKFFAIGRCAKGTSCPFSHAVTAAVPGLPVPGVPEAAAWGIPPQALPALPQWLTDNVPYVPEQAAPPQQVALPRRSGPVTAEERAVLEARARAVLDKYSLTAHAASRDAPVLIQQPLELDDAAETAVEEVDADVLEAAAAAGSAAAGLPFVPLKRKRPQVVEAEDAKPAAEADGSANGEGGEEGGAEQQRAALRRKRGGAIPTQSPL
ncbi:unnamed protein product [Phaeothamnion confervicola]